MIRLALRTVAVAIAVLGAIDPAFTAARHVRPDISLIAAGRLPDPALIDRVARALEDEFTVIRGDAMGAAAVVSVGYQRPALAPRMPVPSFAVVPAPDVPFVAIASLTAATRAHLETQVRLHARIHVVAARGRTMRVTLHSGDVPLQSVTRQVTTDDGQEDVDLSLVPPSTGTIAATVSAEIEGTSARDEATTQTTAGVERLTILLFDTRPSWLSTFIRRALEGDPRFEVTSRVQTSRAAGLSRGRAPVALGAAGSLEAFDAVLVGAPNGLTSSDAAALDTYMRQHRGRVVLLQDEPEASAVVQRLTGIPRWTDTVRAAPEGRPAATEFLRPAVVPSWASLLEPAAPAAPAAPAGPAVLSIPIGSGRLVVNLALDAWRYRDTDAGAFDRAWRMLVADATEGPRVQEAQGVQGVQGSNNERELLRAWTSSRGGAAVSERELTALPTALAAAIDPPSERRVIYPMRSAWWIVPFGLALGGEWWLRRRRGER